MPVVVVDSKEFYNRARTVLELESYERAGLIREVDKLCFEYGLEYDGEDPEYRPDDDTRVGLRIEIPANRYDLLCLEGITDALVRFKTDRAGLTPIRYKHSIAQPKETIIVKSSVAEIRPFCVGAIFRDCAFTSTSLQAFMDLQDKLHQTLGRRRTLVSCGTHDLDTIQGPFTYHALPKHNGFKFIPLGKSDEMDASKMFDTLRHTHLKPYLHIIEDSHLTPVIQDINHIVMSVPPIINSEHSKMTSNTTNVLVEITATDIYKASCYLDVITIFLSEHSTHKFTVEPILVKYDDGHPGVRKAFYDPVLGAETDSHEMLTEIVTPSLKTRKFNVKCDYISSLSGVPQVTASQVAEYLPKMGLDVIDQTADGKEIVVECPITRRDILHPCDIVEDFAVAYGFNNIKHSLHPSVGFQSIQNLSDRVRRELSNCGWRECLTFGLISLNDALGDLGRDVAPAVTSSDFWFGRNRRPAVVSDPKTKDFECVRPTLVPGLLKTISSNQAAELPIRLFEIGDVAYLASPGSECSVAETGMCQRRHVAAIIAHHSRSALEDIHGLLDTVLKTLRLKADYDHTSHTHIRHHHTYRLTELDDEHLFLPGRAIGIEIMTPQCDETQHPTKHSDEVRLLGIMGVVHPQVLEKFNVPFPCSVFEFTLDPFLQWLDTTELITF